MDNDVIGEMNREEGVGAALEVDDDQAFEEARELNDEDEGPEVDGPV
jgi:hypothetical protein